MERRLVDLNLVVVLISILRMVALPLPPVGAAVEEINNFYDIQIEVLANLSKAWHQRPGELDNYLAGWNISNPIHPCYSKTGQENWQGVQCLRLLSQSNSSFYEYEVRVTGLILRGASIQGVLPQELWKLQILSTLILTGNPELTGPLPAEYISMNQASLFTLTLSDNGLDGEIPANLSLCSYLSDLDLSNNSFSGQIPNLPTSSSLQTVNLSANQFTEVPASFCMSTFDGKFAEALTTLDLSYNHISTNISQWELHTLLFLKTIHLDSNNISGTLDVDHLSTMMQLSYNTSNGTYTTAFNSSNINNSYTYFYSSTQWSVGTVDLQYNNITNVSYNWSRGFPNFQIRLQGNPFCWLTINDTNTTLLQACFCEGDCYRESYPQSSTPPGTNNKSLIIIVTSVSAFTFCLGLLIVIFAFSKFKRGLQGKLEEDLQQLLQQKCDDSDVKPTIFKYDELHIATQGFHTNMKLGEGGFGAVYKIVVAVKKMFIKHEQGIGEFCNEVVLITEMRHRNLVKLKGCCLRESQRLLLYEYMENSDLHQALFEGKCVDTMDWPIRFKICVGIAHGLHYLHALAEPRIIHRDIKANNVLLDKDFQPKIADFGLALLFPDEKTHIMASTVAGTKGYLAPEYATMGQLSEKVDVYSFGVVLLEIVSGRKNIDFNKPEDQEYLINWAWALHEDGKLIDLIDPTLHLDESEQLEAQRVINVALLCLQFSDVKRPTMAHVVTMLQGDHLHNLAVPDHGSGVKLERESSMLKKLINTCSFGSALTTIKEEHEIPLFATSSSTASEEGSSSSNANRELELRRIQSR